MSKSLVLDDEHGEPISIDLKPGMGWVLYLDDGPGGPCGQSIRITCPHGFLAIYSNEADMNEALSKAKYRNRKHKLLTGVVGSHTVGGVFTVIDATK